MNMQGGRLLNFIFTVVAIVVGTLLPLITFVFSSRVIGLCCSQFSVLLKDTSILAVQLVGCLLGGLIAGALTTRGYAPVAIAIAAMLLLMFVGFAASLIELWRLYDVLFAFVELVLIVSGLMVGFVMGRAARSRVARASDARLSHDIEAASGRSQT